MAATPRGERAPALPVPPPLRRCLICGPANPRGLRLPFHERGERVVARFTPRPRHQGYRGLMSGGLLAAIFDCLHYRLSLRAGVPHTVTARLEVQYRAPMPVGVPLDLEAWLTERRGRVFVSAAIARRADGVVAAESSAVYVEIDPARLHARPRAPRG
jgi:acyl-coenzyme A thioesterase PaaI-like protein